MCPKGGRGKTETGGWYGSKLKGSGHEQMQEWKKMDEKKKRFEDGRTTERNAAISARHSYWKE